jgi:hypothetical protein
VFVGEELREIFGGAAVLTAAWLRRGLRVAPPFDLLYDPTQDFLKRGSLDEWFESGMFSFGGIAACSHRRAGPTALLAPLLRCRAVGAQKSRGHLQTMRKELEMTRL